MNIHLVLEIVGSVVMLLLTVIGFFLREKLHTVESRASTAEAKLHQLEIGASSERVEAKAQIARLEQRVGALESVVRALEVKGAAGEVEMRNVVQALAAISEMKAEMALKFVSREDMATLLERVDQIATQIADLRVTFATGKAAHG